MYQCSSAFIIYKCTNAKCFDNLSVSVPSAIIISVFQCSSAIIIYKCVPVNNFSKVWDSEPRLDANVVCLSW